MIERPIRNYLLAALVLLCTLGLGWFVYAPALGGDFMLDDLPNLEGLEKIDGPESAVRFVFSGTAGPIGRPIALASFLIHADQSGLSAASFLTFNLLLHLLNAALLAGLLLQLSRARRIDTGKALVVALSATAIWLFMPLLASSSLMIVQRMTTLSATFVLLGLNAYLMARTHIERRTVFALGGMSTSLIVGTLLAVLTKENGIVLPTLAFVAEATLLTDPSRVRSKVWRTWKCIFLWLPTIAIAVYLLTQIPYDGNMVLRRGFDGWQRLLTESRILWQYLFYAFIPRPGSFGPFHDSYPIAESILNPVTFLALTSWIALVAAAILWRRRYPLFAFAVLWYLSAHMLESTVLPLELYFEHRNYLPLIGPAYALCAIALQLSAGRLRIYFAAMPLYVLVMAFTLFGVTTLWGNPPLATHYWKKQFPDSVRAATAVARYQLLNDRPDLTLATLHELAREQPQAAYVGIQALDLACVLSPHEDHGAAVIDLEHRLEAAAFTHSAATMLSGLLSTVQRVDCKGVDRDSVRRLAMALVGNPRYANSKLYNQLHQQLLATIARLDGDPEAAIAHIERAIAYLPTTDLNSMMVVTYVEAGQFERAYRFIDSARQRAPLNPLRSIVWNNDLQNLDLYVAEMEHYDRTGAIPDDGARQ